LAEVYQPSTRVYQGLPDIDYPLHDKTIVVPKCGRMCLGHKKITEVHGDIWLVSVMDYDQGYFDLETRVLDHWKIPSAQKCYLCSRYIL
jgi:putative transposase